MMRVFAAVAFAASVAGCSGAQLLPPPLLTVQQIQAQQALTASIPPVQIHDFLVSGLTLAQMNCGGYFDQAVASALQNAQTVGQANILTGLILGVAGLTGVGGPAVSGIGLGASAINGLLNNQLSNSLAGTDPAGMYTLTATAQQALITALPTPASGADAYAAVYAVERACTAAGIQALKEQAIAAAPSHLSVVGGVSPSPMASIKRGNAPSSRPPALLPTAVVR